MAIDKISLKNNKISWRARWREINGHQVAKRFKTKIEAQNFLLQKENLRAELKSSGLEHLSFEETLFSTEAKKWFNECSKAFSPSYIKRIQSTFNKLLPKIGKLKPMMLTPQRLTSIQNEYLSKGLSPGSVNRELRIVLTVLNHSTRMKRIPSNPSFGFKLLKDKAKEMNFWEEEEALFFLQAMNKKYLKHSDKRWIYLVYLIEINTGLRAGELWGLKVCDLVQGGTLLSIRRQWDRVSNTLRYPKHQKCRKVPCNQQIHEEFSNWVNLAQRQPSELLFQSTYGNAICHDNFIPRIFKKDLKETGVRDIRFHDLRHTAGTLMISKGIDVVTVKEILGHSDIKTTMRYVHVLGSSLKNVAQNFSIAPEVEEHPTPPPRPLKLIHFG